MCACGLIRRTDELRYYRDPHDASAFVHPYASPWSDRFDHRATSDGMISCLRSTLDQNDEGMMAIIVKSLDNILSMSPSLGFAWNGSFVELKTTA